MRYILTFTAAAAATAAYRHTDPEPPVRRFAGASANRIKEDGGEQKVALLRNLWLTEYTQKSFEAAQGRLQTAISKTWR